MPLKVTHDPATLRKIIFVRCLQNFPTIVNFSRLSVLCSHKKWNRSFPQETPVRIFYCRKINYKDMLCHLFTSCVNFIYQVLNFPHCRYGKITLIHCLITWKSSQSSTLGQWSHEWKFCCYQKKSLISETDISQGQSQKGVQKYMYMNGCGNF